MDLGVRPPPAEIAVEARDPRRRLVAPSIVLESFRGKIESPLTAAHAVLHGAADTSVGAPGRVEFESVVVEAVLHLQADRSAEGVEAERRIVGPDVGAADRDRRDEIPVDGVAEGFVDANALHVDSKPLRGALQRRGREAAIAQVLEEAIALDVSGDDAGNPLLQGIEYIGRIDAREIFRGNGLRHRRHLVAIKADAGHRRGRDDLVGRQRAGYRSRRGSNGQRRRPAGGRRLPSWRTGRGTRRNDSDLRQGRCHLTPCHVRQHCQSRQYQGAQCSGFQKPPLPDRQPRLIPTTPACPTHDTAPDFPASTLGHSKSSVLLRFAIRDGNMWQCGNGDTPWPRTGCARNPMLRCINRGTERYDSAATSCTARRISSGRFLALSFCLSCEQALTTVL